MVLAMVLGTVGGGLLAYALNLPSGSASGSAMWVNVTSGSTLGLCAALFILFGVLRPDIIRRERARVR